MLESMLSINLEIVLKCLVAAGYQKPGGGGVSVPNFEQCVKKGAAMLQAGRVDHLSV